ncbi:hypothetical protein [Pseudomonas sp. NFX5]|uniref:hypothetical protein n=1 Tax=Pseudomonas sp. NFX5 TaxID=2816961 RepID=UPI003B8AA2CC
MIEETVKFIEELQGSELFHYVNANGVYLGGWNGDPPFGSIKAPAPEWADQVWSFDTLTWSESPSQLIATENAWREEQMPLAQQTVTALTYGEEGISGTVSGWQKYWLALRKWTADNPEFPDSGKRPVAPT